jgi:hypothetical protein
MRKRQKCMDAVTRDLSMKLGRAPVGIDHSANGG